MGEFNISSDIPVSDTSINRGEEAEIPSDTFDDLDKLAKVGKHKRHQNFQSSLNCIVILSLWAIFLSVLSCGAVYLLHMLIPKCKHFLTPDQLEQIRTFVVTAILSSSLTNYANRHINEE